MPDGELEDLLRQLAPQVLGALVRRFGHFDTAEDAVQEALLAAAVQWPQEGWPDNPKGWLITVAVRRLTDLLRSEQARRRREDTVGHWALTQAHPDPGGDRNPADSDDTLTLLFLCCHPSLSVASQIALTLRAVGGLTTTEIARALLVSESSVTRRITRAKQTIKTSGLPFAMPSAGEAVGRLDAVLRVLYLIFTEGYASTAGPDLQRAELAAEAIRLTRMVHTAQPADSEVAGLIALMLLIHARHRARTGPDGTLIPMAEQDRSVWDAGEIAEGVGIYVGRFSRARLNGQLCSWTWQKPRTQRSSHGRAAFSKGQSLTAIRTPTDADPSSGPKDGSEAAQPSNRNQRTQMPPSGSHRTTRATGAWSTCSAEGRRSGRWSR